MVIVPREGTSLNSPTIRRQLKELRIQGDISIELDYTADPGRMIEWVEEAYRETDRLMYMSGLHG